MIKALQLFSTPESVIEIRALNCWDRNQEYQCTRMGYFDHQHLGEAVDAAKALEATWHASGIYITLNPVRPDLLARAANRVTKGQKGESTKDTEIVSRRWMLIDFDPKRPAGISSTEDELQAARESAMNCWGWLTGQGFPLPVVTMSGNGWHLLYSIDLPAGDGELIERCLKALDERFSTSAVSVDTKVGNPARITKLYGTLTRKGDSTPDRPNRRSEIVETPDPIECVPLDRLEWLAGTASKKDATKPSASSEHHSSESLRVEHWLTRHGHPPIKHETTTDGSSRWFIRCPGYDAHGILSKSTNKQSVNKDSDCCITQSADGKLGGHCFHGSCGMSDWQALKAAVGPLEYQDYHDESGLSVVNLDGILIRKTDSVEVVDDEDDDEEDAKLDRILARDDYTFSAGIPLDCLRPPGLLAEIIDHNMTHAMLPQPELALAAALALMSIITARRIKGLHGMRGNMLILGMAPSRNGKERSRDIIKEILDRLGESRLYEEGLASKSAMFGMLAADSTGLLMLDEVHELFAQASSAGGVNSQQGMIVETIKRLHGASNQNYKSQRFKDNEQQTLLYQPHVTMYGTTTREMLAQSSSPAFVTGGLFARLAMFCGSSIPADYIPAQKNDTPVPDSILRQVENWLRVGRDGGSSGNLSWLNKPQPLQMDYSSEAAARWEEHAISINRQRKNEAGSVRGDLWGESAAQSLKISMLFGASENSGSLRVTLDNMELAIKLSNWLTRGKIAFALGEVSGSEHERNLQFVLKAIRKHPEGISRSALTAATQRKMRAKVLDEFIASLIVSRLIEPAPRKTSRKETMFYKPRLIQYGEWK